ncbi:MAG: tRNA (N6-threonylcarbamoyladenosine(37)-N6)-methyltransferase TrmO [Euryarchaeota archaeon]|jgi:tRNA-Thr(GGU) m(6)t(6)A37 methyltransferase TsaA|nr:tRNA (N6-threonylcarbamoyladenosine(37)-N6)-methyltransferase TrmO [Euryarchaeota archaeon]
MDSYKRKMELTTIGTVKSPYKSRGEAPHQGRNQAELSEIIIQPEFEEALEGVEGYHQLIIIYWFDRAEDPLMKVVPHGRTKKRGIFSTRAPPRPNPIGLTMVDLIKREGPVLTVRGLDALDGSPVLDIKPYLPDLDSV